MANSNNVFSYSGVGTPSNPEPKSNIYIDILQYIVIFLAILVIIYIFFIIPTQVSGQSMEPNFQDNDILLSDRFVQVTGSDEGLIPNYDYTYGDVVVFQRQGEPNLIKRIIAREGDRVKIEAGRVYLNGELLEEPYIDHAEKPTNPGSFLDEGQEVTVPENHFFALGDNRINSIDSRSADVGFIERSQFQGRPFIQVFPEFQRIRNPY